MKEMDYIGDYFEMEQKTWELLDKAAIQVVLDALMETYQLSLIHI